MLFEGHLLAYDPTYNVAEWVLVRGMAGDLSPANSARELSNITLLDVPDDVPWMERFGERHAEPTPIAAPSTKISAPAEEMERDSLLAEGGTDVCHAECCAESEPMSPDTTETAMQEVEIMDVEF